MSSSDAAAIAAGWARPASRTCSRTVLPSHAAANAGSFSLSAPSAARLSAEFTSAMNPRVSSVDQSLR